MNDRRTGNIIIGVALSVALGIGVAALLSIWARMLWLNEPKIDALILVGSLVTVCVLWEVDRKA